MIDTSVLVEGFYPHGLEKDLADRQTRNAVRVVAAAEECDLDTAVARIRGTFDEVLAR